METEVLVEVAAQQRGVEQALPADPDTPLGAEYLGNDVFSFNVWAPRFKEVAVFFPEQERTVVLGRGENGYHCGTIAGVPPASRRFGPSRCPS